MVMLDSDGCIQFLAKEGQGYTKDFSQQKASGGGKTDFSPI